MKWFVYNLLFALVFPFLLPGFLIRMLRRGGYRARMGDRFAIYPKGLWGKGDEPTSRRAEESKQPSTSPAALSTKNYELSTAPKALGTAAQPPIWLHAVSVGEVQVAGQLMREWRKVEPSVRFCFSTTSSTGWKMAEKEVTTADVLIYNPLDFPNFVKSALKTVRPRAIVLTESEIWPVFIRKAKAMGIPLFLINARVSDRSAPRYAKAKFFFGDVFRCFTRIFAQSELDKSRLVAAGAPADRIAVTGSFKFDVAHRNPAKEAELRAWLGGGAGRVLLGGSTWPGEDEVLLRIYRQVLAVDASARLVLAPRHFEKADAVEANIRKAGFGCIRRSRGESAAAPGANDPKNSVFLADTTGELMGLYGIADAVFVGKSLCEHGSQNMIEPCLCGKPTVVGPYTENFRPVMSDLLEGQGIVQVADEAELTQTILGWFTQGDAGLGARASRAVARRTGVVPKCVAAIRAAIPACPVATPPPPFRWIRTLVLTALTVVALAVVHVAVREAASRFGAAREEQPPAAEAAVSPVSADEKPRPKLKAIRMVGAYLAMLERPESTSVYLADAEARQYEPIFKSVGLLCATPETADPDRHYDIVFTGSVPEGQDWTALRAKMARRGVLACALDVQKMTAAQFKEVLERFPCPEPHFWMPGEHDWLLTGRATACRLKMTALLEFFTQKDTVVTVAAEEAGCGSAPELFANYVGTRADVMPAFATGDLSAQVRPEFFITEEMPDLNWIAPEGMDADVVDALAEGIRRAHTVRCKVVQGNMLSAQGKVDEAVEAWSQANVSNPRDTMLLDRLYQLVVNARAFSQFGRPMDALQCYEIFTAIRPADQSVMAEYCRTLRLVGRAEDAAKIESDLNALRYSTLMNEVENKEEKK